MTETKQRYEIVDMHYFQIDGDGYVTQICNPITRSWALVIPPVLAVDIDLGALQYKWSQYCMAAWDLPARRDPKVINPSLLMDDQAQVDVMDSTLFGLIREHGYWAVKNALEKLDPNAKSGDERAHFGDLAPIEPVPVPEGESRERPKPRISEYRLGGLPVPSNE